LNPAEPRPIWKKSQARRDMDYPIPIASRKIMLVALAAPPTAFMTDAVFEHGQLVFASQNRPSSINLTASL
jgi:hypothetical protein